VILNVLYDFTSGAAGYRPFAGLIQGSDGNLYGTTYYGGSAFGTIFKITPAGALTTLAAFTGGNGEYPFAGLVQGTDGNFYGTTNPSEYSTSGSNLGNVFKLTSAGTLSTLATFNGFNGAYPFAGLILGTDSNFYGAAFDGGASGYGTIFAITPAGALTTLAAFTGINGAGPIGDLIQGSDGNFYGTTYYGGGTFVSATSPGDGAVFKATPSGFLTALVSFTGSNGKYPAGNLVQGSDGNFYGTTTEDSSGDNGTMFKMASNGVLTTLVFFNGKNGQYPNGLTQGSDGNFYGTAESGGDSVGDGTIFGITPTGNLTVVAAFDGGSEPLATLVLGKDGNFYGTTPYGGRYNDGVVFQLIVPVATIAPVFSPAAGSFTAAQTVSLTSASVGAAIRYTTDGSTPTETNGTLYSGPIAIGTTTTLKAIAYRSGFPDSPVVSGNYTILPPPTSSSATGGGGGGGGAPSWWFLGVLALLAALRWKLQPKARRENG